MPPKIVQENLFALGRQATPVALTATTNGLVRAGKLVMGAGAAEDLVQFAQRRKMDNLNELAGLAVTAYGTRLTKTVGPWRYGFLTVGYDTLFSFGLFQAKYHPSEDSNLRLIEYSVTKLLEWLAWNQDWHVRMNYPGIGLGGLSRDDVEPLLSDLPEERVTVCWR